MPGPNKKDPKLKLLQGNPGGKPVKDKPAPKKRNRVLSTPSNLGQHGAREWYRTCKILQEMGILFDADRTILHAYCAAYQRWYVALKQLEETKLLTILSKNGMIQAAPIVGIVEKAEASMTRHLERLGLTPASRANVGMPTPPKTEQESAKQAASDFLYNSP